MRGIPGTITQYGIENTIKPVAAVQPPQSDQYVVKITFRDGTVSVRTDIGNNPYSEAEADSIVRSLNGPGIETSWTVEKVKI